MAPKDMRCVMGLVVFKRVLAMGMIGLCVGCGPSEYFLNEKNESPVHRSKKSQDGGSPPPVLSPTPVASSAATPIATTVLRPRVHQVTQTFEASLKQDPKLDLVFVIDNSGSMKDNQENLRDNFDQFADAYLAAKTRDTCITILTTDLVLYPHTLRRLGCDDLKEKFKKAVTVGTLGSRNERPFDSLSLYLDRSHNFRPNALVGIVFVTDEKDGSSLTSLNMKQKLDAKMKISGVSQYFIAGIITPPEKLTESNKDQSGDESHAKKIAELATLTGNGSFTTSILNPWANILEKLGSTIISLQDSFYLESPVDPNLWTETLAEALFPEKSMPLDIEFFTLSNDNKSLKIRSAEIPTSDIPEFIRFTYWSPL